MSLFRSSSGILILAGLSLLNACKNQDPQPNVDPLFEKVTGFLIDTRDIKWLSTDRGLYSLDEESGAYIRATDPQTQQPLNDLALSTEAGKEKLWVATDSGAYNVTDQYHLSPVKSGMPGDRLNLLHFGNNPAAGYFAGELGLDILLGGNWTTFEGQEGLFLRYGISGLATANNGYTYAGTPGGGVQRFVAGIDGISGATVFDTDWSQLPSNNILCTYVSDTIQAFGTTRGVALHFSAYTKWDWETFDSSHGLVNDTVFSVCRDPGGTWWFGTPGGLSSYEPLSLTWNSYTLNSHGLLSDTISFLARDSKGSIWMASTAGLSVLDGDQVINYPK
jgi:ligand-binding sensor domain-containing protein